MNGGPLVGLDPGRSKCGLALTDPQWRSVQEALVLSPEASWQQLIDWQRQGPLAAVVLGNGTGSATWRARLKGFCPLIVVQEAGSTLEARGRYWELFPALGWRRLLPAGLRLPPRDVDDVVAQLLLERHLGYLLEWRA